MGLRSTVRERTNGVYRFRTQAACEGMLAGFECARFTLSLKTQRREMAFSHGFNLCFLNY